MTPSFLHSLAGRYRDLRVAVVGDFCLDRYLEIDPARAETSLETGLPVHNVVRARAQPGAAGTVLNNLVALGIGRIIPIGFCGDDGEGYELLRALRRLPGVELSHFLQTAERRTFTYTKPLILKPGEPPQELNRLDSKNWTPTPASVSAKLAASLEKVRGSLDAVIVMDQVDHAGTGVVTTELLAVLGVWAQENPALPIVADCRRGLSEYPPLIFKANEAEFSALAGLAAGLSLDEISAAAAALATRQNRAVFVTLAARGIVGALPGGQVHHVESLPLRGPIDVVGAGDSVTANVAAALAAGVSLEETLQLASAASSFVIHQLGDSGAASLEQMEQLLWPAR